MIDITNGMLALWHRLLAIMNADDHQFWEEDGGARREFLDATVALHRLCGLSPAQCSPVDAIPAEPPRWMIGQERADYARAHRLAVLFEQAAARTARPRPPGEAPPEMTHASATAARMRAHRAREKAGRGLFTVELDVVRLETLLEHEGLLPAGVDHRHEDVEAALEQMLEP